MYLPIKDDFLKVNTDAAAAKSLHSCLTLCDPIDGSPPGSPITWILQARTLEWVAISFSNAWNWKMKVKSFSHVWLLATPGTAAYQAPPSMGFSRQEYWSGVPLPSLKVNTSLNNLCCSRWPITNVETHWDMIWTLIHDFVSSLLQTIAHLELC